MNGIESLPIVQSMETYLPNSSPSVSDSGSFWLRVSGKKKEAMPVHRANTPYSKDGSGSQTSSRLSKMEIVMCYIA